MKGDSLISAYQPGAVGRSGVYQICGFRHRTSLQGQKTDRQMFSTHFPKYKDVYRNLKRSVERLLGMIEEKLKKIPYISKLMAIAYKVIRIFYVILTKSVDYDLLKMMGEIRKNSGTGCIKGQNNKRKCWIEPVTVVLSLFGENCELDIAVAGQMRKYA